MDHLIKGTDEKDKAIMAHIEISIDEWLQHAYEDKARRCMDRICELISDKQAAKMTDEEKTEILKTVEILPATAARQGMDLAQRMVKK